MSSNSSIEWTDATWVVTTGCTEASSGCANCYARGMSKRLKAMAEADVAAGRDPGKKAGYALSVLGDGRWSGVVTPIEDALSEPFRWRKPRRIFVNSMSDLFWGTERDLKDARRRGVKEPRPVPFEFIAAVYGVMQSCNHHTFQVLTKRPERAVEFYQWVREHGVTDGFGTRWSPEAAWCCVQGMSANVSASALAYAHGSWPPPNIWLGTSVENQSTADERIPHLLRCPAAVRFLSCEPLLGEVDLRQLHACGDCGWWPTSDGSRCEQCLPHPAPDGWHQSRIHWVIVGGESGHGARPCNVDWIRGIVAQCKAAGIPAFVKQMGSNAVYAGRECADCNGTGREQMPCDAFDTVCEFCEGSGYSEQPIHRGYRSKKGSDPSEWPADLRIRQTPAAPEGNR